MINNKLGLLGNNGPLTIIVGKQFHNNPLLLDEINIDDIKLNSPDKLDDHYICNLKYRI